MANVQVILDLVDRASRPLQQFTQNVESAAGRVTTSARSMERSLDNLQRLIAGGFVVTQLYRFVDGLQLMNNKLLATTGSTEQLNTALAATRKISDTTGTAITDIGTLYSKVSANAEKLNLDQDQVVTTTYAFANALKASGASAQGAASSLYQFGQILNKGKADGDEMRTILENLSGPVLEMLAKQLGTNVEGLMKLRTDGKLTAEMLSKAFVGASAEIEAVADKMPTSLSQAMNRITNAFGDLILTMERTTGIFSGIAKGLTWLSENLETVAVTIAAVAGAWAAMKIVGWIPIIIEVGMAMLTLAKAIRTVGLAAVTMQSLATGGIAAVAAVAGAAGAAIAAEKAFEKLDANTVKLEGSLTDVGARARGTTGDIRNLKDEASTGVDMERAAKEADRFVESLRKQVREYGLIGAEKAKVQAETFALNDAQKQEVATLTQTLAAKEKAKKAQEEADRASKKSADERKRATEQLIKGFNQELDKIEKQRIGYDQLSASAKLRYDLENGELAKLDPKKKALLVQLQQEADAYQLVADRAKQQYDLMVSVQELGTKTVGDTKAASTYYNDLITVGKEQAEINKKAAEAVRGLEDAYEGVKVRIEATQVLVANLKEEQAKGGKINEGLLNTYNQQLAALQMQAGVYSAMLNGGSFAQVQAQIKANLTSQQEINLQTKMYNDLVAQPAAELKLINDEMAILKQYLKDGVIGVQQFDVEMGKLHERRFKALGKELTDFEQAAVKAAKGMENSMSSFFFDLMQGKITDLATSFKQMIDKMVADYLASVIAQELFGGFVSPNVNRRGVAASGGTGLVGAAMQWLGGMFRAGGGDVASGSPYIVGEIGPELFIPKSSGTIIPADVTAGMMGSAGGNNLTVQVTAMDSQDVLRAMDKIKRPLAEMMNGTNRTYNMGAR